MKISYEKSYSVQTWSHAANVNNQETFETESKHLIGHLALSFCCKGFGGGGEDGERAATFQRNFRHLKRFSIS